MPRPPTFQPITGTGDIGVSAGAGGPSILDHRPRGHWARLTSPGSGGEGDPPAHAYGHKAVVPIGAGEWADAGPGWPAGSPGIAPAFEAGGATGLPTEADGEGEGLVVWLEPAGDLGFVFRAAGGPVEISVPIQWTLVPGDPCTLVVSAYATIRRGINGDWTTTTVPGTTTGYTFTGAGGAVTIDTESDDGGIVLTGAAP